MQFFCVPRNNYHIVNMKKKILSRDESLLNSSAVLMAQMLFSILSKVNKNGTKNSCIFYSNRYIINTRKIRFLNRRIPFGFHLEPNGSDVFFLLK